MRRRSAFSIAVVVGILLLGLTSWAPAAAVPVGDEPVTTLDRQPDGGGIIPRPDSGQEPEDAGDRGGVLQTALFVAVLGGVVLIATLVVRESRKARADRGF